MKTITKTVYNYDELTGSAKDSARQWLTACVTDYEWYDAVYEDVITIGALMGLNIETRYRGEAGRPDLWFQLGYTQSDGACWGGTIDADKFKGAYRRVKGYAPQDATLHQIARDCEDMYKAMRQYQKTFKREWEDIRQYTVASDDRHHSSRVDGRDGQIVAGLDAIARDFNRWIYNQLRAEGEYQTSEESLLDMAQANEYTFDEWGNREG